MGLARMAFVPELWIEAHAAAIGGRRETVGQEKLDGFAVRVARLVEPGRIPGSLRKIGGPIDVIIAGACWWAGRPGMSRVAPGGETMAVRGRSRIARWSGRG